MRYTVWIFDESLYNIEDSVRSEPFFDLFPQETLTLLTDGLTVAVLSSSAARHLFRIVKRHRVGKRLRVDCSVDEAVGHEDHLNEHFPPDLRGKLRVEDVDRKSVV